MINSYPERASPQPVGLLTVYVSGLVLGAVGLAIGLATSGLELASPALVVGLAFVAILAERGSVRLTARTEVSISLVPTLFASVLLGPLAGLLVAAASNLNDLWGANRSYLKWATYTSSRALTGAASGFSALTTRSAFDSDVLGLALATAAAAITAGVLDLGFAGVTGLLRGIQFSATFRTLAPLALVSIPVYAPIVAVLAVAYSALSPWSLLLFLTPAVAAQRLYVLYHGQRQLTDDVLLAKERLERANLSFATALVAALDARDRYTAGHSASVAVYARDIAERMGLSAEDQRLAHLCGLVHDIGKIGLPAGLLEKRGPLTLAERRTMEQHSVIGERILRNVEDYSEIASIVRHHHERVDGQGYPDGLRGEEIPWISRIIAVADAYDAMTSDRPYRDAMPARVARLRLAQAVESQFDTTVVAAFEAILAGADPEYTSGRRADFVFEAQLQVGSLAADPEVSLGSVRAESHA